tara:strand:+ start:517 stop:924 length:408 start_codon:yes stop_codon:yes gene_type:complete
MYEVTMEELSVFVALGFCCGVFASVFLGRFFEVVHLHRMVRETTIHLIWMLAKMTEDIHFLRQLKRSAMEEAHFTPEQVKRFEETDDKFLTNWKDTVILALVSRSPRHFRGMLPFKSWNQAISFMNEALREERTK